MPCFMGYLVHACTSPNVQSDTPDNMFSLCGVVYVMGDRAEMCDTSNASRYKEIPLLMLAVEK